MDAELVKGLLRGGRDVVGSVGSSLLAEPVAGIAGLAQLLRTGGDTQRATDTINSIREALTYVPTDDASRRSLDLIAKPFEMLDEHVIKPVSDKAYEVGGPFAGAAVNTALNVVDPFKGKGKAVNNLAKLRREGQLFAADAQHPLLLNFHDPVQYEHFAARFDPDGEVQINQLDTMIRHEIARLNAEMPVEHGGLGLPEGHTALDRAKAMGYDEDVYHGSMFNNIEAFDTNRDSGGNYAGEGHYTTSNPADASKHYAHVDGPDVSSKIESAMFDFDENFTDVNKEKIPYEINQYMAHSQEGIPLIDQFGADDTAELVRQLGVGNSLGAVYPLKLRKGNTFDTTQLDATKWPNHPLTAMGQMDLNPDDFDTLAHNAHWSWVQNNPETAGAKHFIAKDPSQLRSRFAAFDPAQKNSSNLLAFTGGGMPDPKELLKQKLRKVAFNTLSQGSDTQGE